MRYKCSYAFCSCSDCRSHQSHKSSPRHATASARRLLPLTSTDTTWSGHHSDASGSPDLAFSFPERQAQFLLLRIEKMQIQNVLLSLLLSSLFSAPFFFFLLQRVHCVNLTSPVPQKVRLASPRASKPCISDPGRGLQHTEQTYSVVLLKCNRLDLSLSVVT